MKSISILVFLLVLPVCLNAKTPKKKPWGLLQALDKNNIKEVGTPVGPKPYFSDRSKLLSKTTGSIELKEPPVVVLNLTNEKKKEYQLEKFDEFAILCMATKAHEVDYRSDSFDFFVYGVPGAKQFSYLDTRTEN